MIRYLAALVLLAGWISDAVIYSYEPLYCRMGEIMPGYWLQVTGGVNFAQKLILYFVAAWILAGLYFNQKHDNRKMFWLQFGLVVILTLVECGFRYSLAVSDGSMFGGRFKTLYMDLSLFGLGSTAACAIAPLYGLSAGATIGGLAQKWRRK